MALFSFLSPQRRFASRRLTCLFVFVVVFGCLFFAAIPTPAPATDSATEDESDPEASAAPKPKSHLSIPGIDVSRISDKISKSSLNPWRQPLHPPARNNKDSFKGSSWWSDWKWLAVPFSSTLTPHDDRALLPPLAERPYIYCYYDATLKKTREEKDAESDLLLTWRRAWWAQGFRPIMLSASEAMSNPRYKRLQTLDIDEALKKDIMRWLAWEAMGGGLLAHWTLLPMAHNADPLLVYLRRNEFPQLTRWNGLDSALIAGQDADVSKAIQSLLDSDTTKTATRVIDGIKDSFTIDEQPTSLAYYSNDVIKHEYQTIHEELAKKKAKGLNSLNKLIHAHLHIAWQYSFPEGIEVITPNPEHSLIMVEPAISVAKSLATCVDNPVPESCPPNIKNCQSCEDGSPAMDLVMTTQYSNSTKSFVIGTVPHPWTLATLDNLKEDLDISWIRRKSDRDPWLKAVTRELLGDKVSGNLRVIHFKQAVADEHASSYALWLTAEAELPTDLVWLFGFPMPHPTTTKDETTDTHTADATSTTSAAEATDAAENKQLQDKKTSGEKTDGKESASKKGKTDEKKTKREQEDAKNKSAEDGKDGKEENGSEQDKTKQPPADDPPAASMTLAEKLKKASALLKRAKGIVGQKKLSDETRLRTSLEAWNMADTEAWKFARAYLARRTMERMNWEKDESKYSRGSGSEKGRNAWSRWQDAKDEKDAKDAKDESTENPEEDEE